MILADAVLAVEDELLVEEVELEPLVLVDDVLVVEVELVLEVTAVVAMGILGDRRLIGHFGGNFSF